MSASVQTSRDELQRENQRLAMQLRRLQDVVSAMRDEIADANAEIVASRRLHDEQKAVLLQELHRERNWREQIQRQAEGRPKSSAGTCTEEDGVRRQGEVGMMTDEAYMAHGMVYEQRVGGNVNRGSFSSGIPGDPETVTTTTRVADGTIAVLPPIDDYGYPISSPYYHYPTNSPPRLLNATGKSGPTAAGATSRVSSFGRERLLQEFADSLCRRTGYFHVDLFSTFRNLGASTVDEVCANVTESDLVGQGVPVIKARGMMHLIMEHTQTLLGTTPYASTFQNNQPSTTTNTPAAAQGHPNNTFVSPTPVPPSHPGYY